MPETMRSQYLYKNKEQRFFQESIPTTLGRLQFYTRFAWRFIVLRKPEPLIYGIAPTDQCNLKCRGCRVANTGRPSMNWDQLLNALQNAWSRGFRELYFGGGEPLLWRDGKHTLEHAIIEAKRIGFFHVHVYTKGTLGLDTSADFVWVSMDGLPGTFEQRRGNYFSRVERTVRESPHPPIRHCPKGCFANANR